MSRLTVYSRGVRYGEWVIERTFPAAYVRSEFGLEIGGQREFDGRIYLAVAEGTPAAELPPRSGEANP